MLVVTNDDGRARGRLAIFEIAVRDRAGDIRVFRLDGVLSLEGGGGP